MITAIWICWGLLGVGLVPAEADGEPASPPNIIFILTDDQRFDAVGYLENSLAQTPHLDQLAAEGVVFTHAFSTLSLCSPSRATSLTGLYARAHGVVGLNQSIPDTIPVFPELLREAGYDTAFVGKWHLRNDPTGLGFAQATWIRGNGVHRGRQVFDRRQTIFRRYVTPAYIEDFLVDRSLELLDEWVGGERPFFLWHCTQVPHLDLEETWPVREESLARYQEVVPPIPSDLGDLLDGKPPFLRDTIGHERFLGPQFAGAEKRTSQYRRYLAAVSEMDSALGRLLERVRSSPLAENTWIFVVSDNGWLVGEHGLVCKVVPYEASIRVPTMVWGPGLAPGSSAAFVHNADLAPTFLELARVPLADAMQGRSMVPLLRDPNAAWRDSFYYEVPSEVLRVWPSQTLRTTAWKYTLTFDPLEPTRVVFEELYDLRSDPEERTNLLVGRPRAEVRALLPGLRAHLEQERDAIGVWP